MFDLCRRESSGSVNAERRVIRQKGVLKIFIWECCLDQIRRAVARYISRRRIYIIIIP